MRAPWLLPAIAAAARFRNHQEAETALQSDLFKEEVALAILGEDREPHWSRAETIKGEVFRR